MNKKSLEYSIHIGVMFKPETVEKLKVLAKQKGYSSSGKDRVGRVLKQPKSGISKVIREIIEKSL